MDYERRFKYQENMPIKEGKYSYYITDIKNINDNNIDNSSSKFYNNNNLISSHMRMSNIESRLTTMEKMMKYFDELLHLKEEEKINNLNSLELSSNIPNNVNELMNKVNNLEKKLDLIQKQKQQSEIENEKIIQNLTKKVEYLENLINSNYLHQHPKTNNIDENNNLNENINNNNLNKVFTFDASKEQNNMENKISEIDDIIKNKLNEIYSNNKINEILNLIEDINKVSEDNEFNINEQNENIRKIQNDNLTLIKVVSVHSEKINSIDYILNELTNLKNKYFKLLSLANNVGNNEKNEAFYNNEMNEKLKEENNNQNENNNNENDEQNNNNNNINNI